MNEEAFVVIIAALWPRDKATGGSKEEGPVAAQQKWPE